MDAQKHLKVLVIDDYPESIDLVRLFLGRQRGDEVIGAEGGYAGIAKAQEVMPEFIILDLEMPDLDGYQVYPQLKALPGLQSIPILFTGVDTTRDVYPIAQSLGAAGYLQEPFAPQQLLAARDAALSGNVYYPSPEQRAVTLVDILMFIFGIPVIIVVLIVVLVFVGLVNAWERLRKALRLPWRGR